MLILKVFIGSFVFSSKTCVPSSTRSNSRRICRFLRRSPSWRSGGALRTTTFSKANSPSNRSDNSSIRPGSRAGFNSGTRPTDSCSLTTSTNKNRHGRGRKAQIQISVILQFFAETAFPPSCWLWSLTAFLSCCSRRVSATLSKSTSTWSFTKCLRTSISSAT